MEHYTLTEEMIDFVAKKLKEAGYEDYKTTGYTGYTKNRGDSVFITYSLNIIRATKETKGHDIIQDYFGTPNGKGSEAEIDRNSSWFFNGYTGRKGTDTLRSLIHS